jgi:two-component system cell cycle response regulator DivK
VLLIDDNMANSRLAEFLLTAHGVEVRTAGDARAALAILEVFEPTVILMDIQLPGMDGLTLTRQLKQNPAMQDVPIVAMTAYAMRGDADRMRAAGCDGYVSKPIDPKTFASVVASYFPPSTSGAGAPAGPLQPAD